MFGNLTSQKVLTGNYNGFSLALDNLTWKIFVQIVPWLVHKHEDWVLEDSETRGNLVGMLGWSGVFLMFFVGFYFV